MKRFIPPAFSSDNRKRLLHTFGRFCNTPVSPAHTHFTLIELLVVIAIIAILAAMLLPALQSARDRGRQTACSNTCKNLTTAITLYQDDNNEYFPKNSGQYPPDFTVTAPIYFVPISRYLMKNPPETYDSAVAKKFWCPTTAATAALNFQAVSFPYGLNLALSFKNNNTQFSRKDMKGVPSKQIMLAETQYSGTDPANDWKDGFYSAQSNKVYGRHGKSVNMGNVKGNCTVSYLDGSIRNVEVKTLQTAPNRSMPWDENLDGK